MRDTHVQRDLLGRVQPNFSYKLSTFPLQVFLSASALTQWIDLFLDSADLLNAMQNKSTLVLMVCIMFIISKNVY